MLWECWWVPCGSGGYQNWKSQSLARPSSYKQKESLLSMGFGSSLLLQVILGFIFVSFTAWIIHNAIFTELILFISRLNVWIFIVVLLLTIFLIPFAGLLGSASLTLISYFLLGLMKLIDFKMQKRLMDNRNIWIFLLNLKFLFQFVATILSMK